MAAFGEALLLAADGEGLAGEASREEVEAGGGEVGGDEVQYVSLDEAMVVSVVVGSIGIVVLLLMFAVIATDVVVVAVVVICIG